MELDEEARVVALLDIEMHRRMEGIRRDAPNIESIYNKRLENIGVELDGCKPIACWYFVNCDVCPINIACYASSSIVVPESLFNGNLAKLEEELRKEV